MGLFDNLLRVADDSLKAIENGALDKAIVNAIDGLEEGLNNFVGSAEKVAEAPANLLESAEAKVQQVEDTARTFQNQAGKSMDIIRQKV